MHALFLVAGILGAIWAASYGVHFGLRLEILKSIGCFLGAIALYMIAKAAEREIDDDEPI